MPLKQGSEPLPYRIRAAHQKLVAAASELNAASDRFALLVAEIDATLKSLNLGIAAWVRLGPGWSDDRGKEGYEEVGYDKINGKWCIGVRAHEWHFSEPEDENPSCWTFGDGPRRLRLKAVEYLPNLLEKLAGDATGETKDVASKAEDLEKMVSVLKEGLQ